MTKQQMEELVKLLKQAENGIDMAASSPDMPEYLSDDLTVDARNVRACREALIGYMEDSHG